jgi:hypothetical protein
VQHSLAKLLGSHVHGVLPQALRTLITTRSSYHGKRLVRDGSPLQLARDQRHSFTRRRRCSVGKASQRGAGAGGAAPLEVERPEPGAPPVLAEWDSTGSPHCEENTTAGRQLREQRGQPQPLAAGGRRLPPPRRLAAGPPPPQPQRSPQAHPYAPAAVTELAAQPLVPAR